MDPDGRMHSMLRNVVGLKLTYTVTKTEVGLKWQKKAGASQTRRAFRTVEAGVYTRNLDRITPTPGIRVLFGKKVVLQLVKILTVFYKARKFDTKRLLISVFLYEKNANGLTE